MRVSLTLTKALKTVMTEGTTTWTLWLCKTSTRRSVVQFNLFWTRSKTTLMDRTFKYHRNNKQTNTSIRVQTKSLHRIKVEKATLRPKLWSQTWKLTRWEQSLPWQVTRILTVLISLFKFVVLEIRVYHRIGILKCLNKQDPTTWETMLSLKTKDKMQTVPLITFTFPKRAQKIGCCQRCPINKTNWVALKQSSLPTLGRVEATAQTNQDKSKLWLKWCPKTSRWIWLTKEVAISRRWVSTRSHLTEQFLCKTNITQRPNPVFGF